MLITDECFDLVKKNVSVKSGQRFIQGEYKNMNAWMIWLMLAGVIVILELFTGTFYLLMIAIGLTVGAVAAAVGAPLEIQLIIGAIISSITTIILHKSRYGWNKSQESSRDPNVNMDIGMHLQVSEWQDQGNGIYIARSTYRGAMWDVELRHSAAYAGTFVIEEIRGSRLIVRPA
ncbi:NfeD family protein [Undibacterium sp. SXout7W]|uniref:NfeD family protein n=1 Tax=Undibacterium sp. SXout7W TaxID=3413049 RepID=UPI003BF3CAC0